MDDAFSLDGQTVEFSLSLSEPVSLGGYLEIEAADGLVVLAQVTECQVAVGADGDDRRYLTGLGRVVGAVAPDGSLQRGAVTSFASQELRPAGAGSVRQHLEGLWPAEARVRLGVTAGASDVPADLRARGFARHTFMCGQSGSGKTYTLGVVLEQLLVNTSLPMAIIDPNSDHIHLGQVVGSPDQDPTGFAARLAAERAGVHVFGVGRDHPMHIHFGALTLDQQTLVLRLDPLRDREEHGAFLSIIAGLGTDQYSLGQIVEAAAARSDGASSQLRHRIENLRLVEGEIWAEPGGPAIGTELPEDFRAIVLDVGSLSQARDRAVMAAGAIAWIWEHRHNRRPILLVVDEAHNVCPAKPMDPDQSMATELLVAIAGEGRKYGIHLLLATQRPQKLHENVLSQCDNLLLMRMNSATDIAVLQDVFSHVPPALIARSSAFVQGQGLAAGPITADPLMFATGRRFTPEGGSDPAPTWADAR